MYVSKNGVNREKTDLIIPVENSNILMQKSLQYIIPLQKADSISAQFSRLLFQMK